MSEKIIKECQVCKKMFEPCSTCHQFSGWRAVVCCPEHYAFHIPIISYIRNKITKEQAKTDLQEAISTYGMIDFNDNILDIVNEILTENIVEPIQEIQEFPVKTSKKSKQV